MKRKIGTILAGVMLAATALSGCSSSTGTKPEATAPAKIEGNQSAAPAATGPDISKSVELVWYLVGDANKDTPKVMDEFNKMLKKDLNATVKLNFTTWNDWQTKYNLLLTAGEKIDMIFASSGRILQICQARCIQGSDRFASNVRAAGPKASFGPGLE